MSVDPLEHDDAGRDEVADATAPSWESGAVSECPLCGAEVQANELRCPRCNMTLAGIDGRPGPFSRAVLLAWAGALLLIYAAVLVVVALVPA